MVENAPIVNMDLSVNALLHILVSSVSRKQTCAITQYVNIVLDVKILEQMSNVVANLDMGEDIVTEVRFCAYSRLFSSE